MLGKKDSWRSALMVGKAPTMIETRRGRNYLAVLITCIFSLREPFSRYSIGGEAFELLSSIWILDVGPLGVDARMLTLD
jgi:hypothetical protein